MAYTPRSQDLKVPCATETRSPVCPFSEARSLCSTRLYLAGPLSEGLWGGGGDLVFKTAAFEVGPGSPWWGRGIRARSGSLVEGGSLKWMLHTEVPG